MNTDFIKRLIEEDPAMAVTELDKLGDIFKRANYDVRTLLGELKPTTLETKGLPAALEEYLERLRPYNEKVQFIFEAKGVSGMTLAKEAQGTLFNIVQESLNNALKYAEARHIWLKLERSGYRLQITIRDDGKGFNVEEGKARAKARGSYGLSNLSDRARLINGRTEIESEPGQGTTIRVHVPLEV
jgi:signal transduction histidine kinase